MSALLRKLYLTTAALSTMLATRMVVAAASFAVAPGHIYLNLDNPRTQAFLIRNTGSELIHLHIKPVFYRIESKALNNGKPLDPKKEATDSLKPYMLISPQAMSLRPGEQREVRISVRAPADLKSGTYRAHVLVNMLEVAGVAKARGTTGLNTSLSMLMEMAVAVYANKGKGTPQFTVTCHRNKKGQLLVHTANTSPWHFDGDVSATQNDKQSKPLPTVIYRDSQLNLTLPWKPEKGEITVKFKPSSQGQTLTQTCTLG